MLPDGRRRGQPGQKVPCRPCPRVKDLDAEAFCQRFFPWYKITVLRGSAYPAAEL
jgi:hypothetical protein